MRRALALTAAYLAITLLMMQSMVNLGALGSACYPGDARLIVWTLAWDNHAVLDRVPLFDANIFYPAASSLQYNEHLLGLSVFTLPIYAATRNPILGYNIIWMLSFVLSALAMHVLVLRHTRSHAAAATAAVIFTFSFYKMLHAHGHLAHIWTWLVPLSLWLMERWIERPSIGRAVAWGFAMILQALGSWYVAVMVLFVNGLALAWHATAIRDRWPRRLGHTLIVGVMGAAVITPLAAKYSALDAPSLTELVAFSADWPAYFIPPEDTWVGQWWLAHVGRGPRWIWGERTLFLGWIASALAVAGAAILIRRREWRRAGLALSCIVFGLLLSFGPSEHRGIERPSLFGMFASLPGISGFRVPARFALVVLFGVSLAAAEAVRAGVARFGRRAVAALLLIWPLMLSEWFVVRMPGGRPVPVDIPAIYRSEPLQTARALVSLPDYRQSREWWLGADYLYYSTINWRPIVNGFGRSEPPGHAHVISYMNAFPGPNNARKMRELGIEYVVLRGAEYPGGIADILRGVSESDDYELVLQAGSDYLFRVRQK